MEKIKILIIDDEKSIGEAVKIGLERSGEYEVRIETRGWKGPAVARKFKPDLILLDIIMPRKNGFEILKILKRDSRTISIPVIMLTMVEGEQAKTQAAQLFDEDYIVKPSSIEELKEKIEKVLRRRLK